MTTRIEYPIDKKQLVDSLKPGMVIVAHPLFQACVCGDVMLITNQEYTPLLASDNISKQTYYIGFNIAITSDSKVLLE